MTQILNFLTADHDWTLAASAGLVCLVIGVAVTVSLIGLVIDRAAKEKLSLLNDALDHMSQGLAMFDDNGHLVLWKSTLRRDVRFTGADPARL